MVGSHHHLTSRGRRAGCRCTHRTSRLRDLHSTHMEATSLSCVLLNYRFPSKTSTTTCRWWEERRRLGNFHSLGLQSFPKSKGTVGVDAEQHGLVSSDVSSTQHCLLMYASIGSTDRKLQQHLPVLPGPDTMCSSTICCRHLAGSYWSKRSPRMCFGSSLSSGFPTLLRAIPSRGEQRGSTRAVVQRIATNTCLLRQETLL